ncbi:MAG: hypothetical protein IPP46_10160 [Bacteroidetes bacterium]|nr:hypothetical protein [Bacteroidota bacterium]
MFKRLSSHGLIILLGSLVWGVLSYYNVLVDDDVVMLRSVKDAGIVGATIGQYETWNTRWMSFFFLHTWMNFWNENSSPLLYHLVTLMALVLASRRLVMAMISKRWIAASSNLQEWFFAGLISTALVVSSYHIGDTWFWVNTSTMYGWNLIALLLAISLVLSPLKNNLLQDILLTFADSISVVRRAGCSMSGVDTACLFVPGPEKNENYFPTYYQFSHWHGR